MTRTSVGHFAFETKPPLHHESDYKRRPYTRNIVVHCSDTPRHMNIGAEEIRDWHVCERGWMDIGYHLVIRRDGTIETGRPLWAAGSGAQGHNVDSIHVCLVGGRNERGFAEDNFEPIQKDALAFVVMALLSVGMTMKESVECDVLGHRDFPGVTKACPSFDVRSWWLKVDRAALASAVHPEAETLKHLLA